jgi:ankyrin repeat protein
VIAATDPLSPTRLVLVSRYGHEREVIYLLQSKVDVNARDKFGGTALMAAAEGGHENIVKILIGANADVNLKSTDNLTALMAAASRGSVPIIKALLAAGAKVDEKDSIGETPLFYAVKLARRDAVRVLLDAGADPNIKNTNSVKASNSGYTPLMYTAERGPSGVAGDWAGIAKMLIDKGARTNERNNHGFSALSIAQRRGDLTLVSVLQAAGAREERSYTSLTDDAALIKAARIGDLEKVKTLLSLGASPDVRDDGGVTPLLAATYEGNLQIVQALVEAGAKINQVPQGLREWAFNASRAPITDRPLMEVASHGDAALIVAIRRAHMPVVEYLLSKGAEPTIANNLGETPIFVAAVEGHGAAIKALLKKGVDPNTLETEKLTVSMTNKLQGMGRNTPLIAAAQGGSAEAVKALIDGGADVNHRGFLDKTALLWAVERGFTNVAEVLLVNKADPNANDTGGLTPLMMAARSGNGRLTSMLLERKADPNRIERADYPGEGGKAFGTSGMTALIYAARGGHADIVKMLIDAKANVNAITDGGDTAIKAASNNGYTQIVDALKLAGAQGM